MTARPSCSVRPNSALSWRAPCMRRAARTGKIERGAYRRGERDFQGRLNDAEGDIIQRLQPVWGEGRPKLLATPDIPHATHRLSALGSIKVPPPADRRPGGRSPLAPRRGSGTPS